MHATCTRVCVCVYKLRYVRVAFSISHTPGGHLPPEAKSHFGRAWLSIMYNRDTSAPRWDRCLPSTCLAFRPAECRRLCPPRARYVAFRLPGTNMSTDRFIVHAACSLAIHAVTVGGPRWLHVTSYLLKRDRGESFRLLTRKPFVCHFSCSTRPRCYPIYFLAEHPVKMSELFSFFVRHYPISF